MIKRLVSRAIVFQLTRPQVMYPLVTTSFYNFTKIGKKKMELQEKKKEKESLNLDQEIDLNKIEDKFKREITTLKEALVKHKMGRFSPADLDQLIVFAYGKKTSLNTLAAISSLAQNVLQLNVYDEGIVNDVMKTLENSNLNITLKREGKIITCTQVGGNTKEQKQNLITKVAQTVDKWKVQLKAVRQEGMDFLKPYKKVSSGDVVKQAEKEVQEIYDKYIEEAEKLQKAKEKEINSS